MAATKRVMLGLGKIGSPESEWVIILIYAPGGSRRIYPIAEAVSDPEHNDKFNPQEEGSCPWKNIF
ncbi:hypothetical protein [Desulfonatronovibrio magnus]|uniref:hypothetical protein n=1 Tax=Desulfonatronovibrio magnus TaxID=698827 RepID=UPI0005EB3590|nr:hypothetical protein [Desulfonatronovibrio magnus]